MLGIDPDEQRRMMEESFDVIMALFRGEIVTRQDRLVHDQRGPPPAAPVQYPMFDVAVAASISPSGPKVGRPPRRRPAVDRRHRRREGFAMLAGHWAVMEEQAADHGTTVDRRKWRMMGPMHIAETEQEALDNCRYGLERVFDYLAPRRAHRPRRRRRPTRAASRR